jgi:hypothetical protein
MIFFQPKRLMGESLRAIAGEANTATLPRRACRENNPAISVSGNRCFIRECTLADLSAPTPSTAIAADRREVTATAYKTWTVCSTHDGVLPKANRS